MVTVEHGLTLLQGLTFTAGASALVPVNAGGSLVSFGNPSTTNPVYFRLANRAGTAPTVSASLFEFICQPADTLFIPVNTTTTAIYAFCASPTTLSAAVLG
jgi:hypothetical protein